jgi:hypothetical protein
MPSEKSEITEIPKYILLLVAMLRVLYPSLVSLAILYMVLPMFNISNLPNQSMTLIEMSRWFAIFTLVSGIIIVVGFRLWVVLSWVTALLISKKTRKNFKEYRYTN